ncbi:MAG: hypothetical protein HUU21_28650 [Polyangiaceae bacterium]|nr:hypothetical protein [Polyangiaceae bacterium]NUQ77527.1 hypothetical protein [Polyangiaceae bacterium]
MMKRFLIFAAALFSVIAVSPGVALACPQCAGREDGGWMQTAVLGVFVFLPWMLVWAVYRFIQSEGRGSSARTQSRLRT